MTQTFDPFDPAEWGDKPGCEAFELAMEMRARSALAPTAVPVLEAHLAACDSCRAHAATANKLDAALAVAPLANVDWHRVQQKLDQHIRRYRRAPWLAGASGLAGGALWVGVRLLTGQPVLMRAVLMMFVLVVIMMLGVRMSVASRLRGLAQPRDVMAAYRGELEHRLARMKIAVPILLVCAVLYLGMFFESLPAALDGDPRALSNAVMKGILFLLMGLASIQAYRSRRRTQRERAELH